MTSNPSHRDYRAVSGLPRPIDQNYGVPGDTPCKCGGIAWYHAKAPFGCDDCEECHEFKPAEESSP